MEIQRGLVVQAKAGRDKGNFFAVLAVDGDVAQIADGRKRRVEKPKHKKLKHLAATNTLFSEEQFATNNKLHKALYEKGLGRKGTTPQTTTEGGRGFG